MGKAENPLDSVLKGQDYDTVETTLEGLLEFVARAWYLSKLFRELEESGKVEFEARGYLESLGFIHIERCLSHRIWERREDECRDVVVLSFGRWSSSQPRTLNIDERND
ncbi:hypothetical protein IMZ48_43325 [Candidatus Bathyarchaeota archaeon]|nr:hypothetical protein [Candidatus Bathyarchaeota archaeon]